jgi:hypothetical protein
MIITLLMSLLLGMAETSLVIRVDRIARDRAPLSYTICLCREPILCENKQLFKFDVEG